MKVVLDTNVLLVSFSERSEAHWIFDFFINEDYTLCITSEILLEYEEIIAREMGIYAAQALMQVLENAPNVERINNWYRWNILSVDPDDNKFLDCALACNARYIVSEDRHFRVLKTMPTLPVQVLRIEEFRSVLEEEKLGE